jgi:hypothetical protein
VHAVRCARGAQQFRLAAAAAHYHNHSEREGSHSLIGSIFPSAQRRIEFLTELEKTFNNKKLCCFFTPGFDFSTYKRSIC